jgi:hypothetical protein
MHKIIKAFEDGNVPDIKVELDHHNLMLADADITSKFVGSKVKHAMTTQKYITDLVLKVKVSLDGEGAIPLEIKGDQALISAIQSSIVNSISFIFDKKSDESEEECTKKRLRYASANSTLKVLKDHSEWKAFNFNPDNLSILTSNTMCGHLFMSDDKLHSLKNEHKAVMDHTDFSHGSVSLASHCPNGSDCGICFVEGVESDTGHHHHHLMIKPTQVADSHIMILPNFVYGAFAPQNITPIENWVRGAVATKLLQITRHDNPNEILEHITEVRMDKFGECISTLTEVMPPKHRQILEVGLLEAFSFILFFDVYDKYIQKFMGQVNEDALMMIDEGGHQAYDKMLTDTIGEIVMDIYSKSRKVRVIGSGREHEYEEDGEDHTEESTHSIEDLMKKLLM